MAEDDTYRKLFVAESIENHENIVNNLLVLENGSDMAAIDEIFRAAHTLKGMSASMGFDEMETLCHSMEDVFHLIRSGERSVNNGLIDILLACTDKIEEMLDDVESGGDCSSITSSELVKQLKSLSSDQTDVSDDKTNQNSQTNTECLLQPQKYSHQITLTIDETSQMKDIRALLSLENLKEIGEIVCCSPSADKLESSDSEFDGILNIYIQTDSNEEEIQNAATVPEISDIIVVPFSSEPETNGQIPADLTPNPDNNLFKVIITVSESSDLGDVRALIAYQNLADIGNIISSEPSLEDLDSGAFSGSLVVILHSDAGYKALHDAASGVDIQNVLVEDFVQEEDSNIKIHSGTQSQNSQAGSGNSPQDNPEKTTKKSKKKEVQNLRVDIHRLDQMMNLVEDLVITGGRLRQIAHQYNSKEMDEALNMVSRSVSDLQNLMMNIRMIPLNQIFNRFPRVVRDVAVHDGKEVEFIMSGGETELDRSVIDGLGDPLLHLIRNAVNHGIEKPENRIMAGKEPKGTVVLSAWREKGNVLIRLKDDGAGIYADAILSKAIEKGFVSPEQSKDLTKDEIINFLFQPGFSTANEITDISGRGVGLDVVKSAIESLKGTISVESAEGKGTTFTLVLPPTMAIIEVMMVRINGKRCAIPIASVVEVARIDRNSISRIGKSEAIPFRGEVLQIHHLNEMFKGESNGDIVVVIQYQETKCCIPVDVVEGQQEVVVKPLSNIIGTCKGVSGVTIPGDGDVVPILDVNSMI
ncbi:chemotaxis protein CheA [Methanogenium organophilum]|uniref:Chemotaxis protein CheA n=1 Tax=Methanogenium organophilum TaxID=2199 RepID=A0A9X9S3J6_METOG|nr:chemotaxis protein CheA [Methanogenium organophilum]WAI01036.1 chemotaxis protein CheA [Methanogenium organophilum]